MQIPISRLQLAWRAAQKRSQEEEERLKLVLEEHRQATTAQPQLFAKLRRAHENVAIAQSQLDQLQKRIDAALCKYDWHEWNPENIAAQVSRVQHDLWQKLMDPLSFQMQHLLRLLAFMTLHTDIYPYHGCTWQVAERLLLPADLKYRFPIYTQLQRWFDFETFLCRSWIASLLNAPNAQKALSHLLQLAHHLLNGFGNVSAFCALASAIQSPPVQRAWEQHIRPLLSSAEREALKQMNEALEGPEKLEGPFWYLIKEQAHFNAHILSAKGVVPIPNRMLIQPSLRPAVDHLFLLGRDYYGGNHLIPGELDPWRLPVEDDYSAPGRSAFNQLQFIYDHCVTHSLLTENNVPKKSLADRKSLAKDPFRDVQMIEDDLVIQHFLLTRTFYSRKQLMHWNARQSVDEDDDALLVWDSESMIEPEMQDLAKNENTAQEGELNVQEELEEDLDLQADDYLDEGK